MTKFSITVQLQSIIDGWTNISGRTMWIEGRAVAEGLRKYRNGIMQINLCERAGDPMYQSITNVPSEFFQKVQDAVNGRNGYTGAELVLSFEGRDLVSVRVANRIAD